MKPGVLYFFMKFGLCLLSIILVPVCWILSLGNKKKCPKINNSLLLHSAKNLALLIRTKQVTCEEVVQAFIAHAKDVNNVVNAIVANRFEEALKEAKNVDIFLASNAKTEEDIRLETPLLGVPITIKESNKVIGMSCNAGRVQMNKIADSDSSSTRLIKNAGAIPILVTNTPESCMFWETFNSVTGKTSNPYDTRRTVGGSSGGEAALISSGGSVIGLGSDLAGSLRIPASFTGIFSHKPSAHAVSTEGCVPKCHDKNFKDYFVVGPLTRYSEDLSLIMSIITEPEAKKALQLDEPVTMQNIKFYYMEKEFESWMASKVDRNIINAMRKFVEHLKTQHNITAEKVQIKEMRNAHAISSVLLLDLEEIEFQWFDKKMKFRFWPNFFRILFCRMKASLPIFSYGVFKGIYNTFMKWTFPQVCKKNEELKIVFKNLLGDNGVLLYPAFTGTAHFHYAMFYKPLDYAYMAIFNMLGLPVTTCPAGFTSDGLPIGFQVIGNQNCDRLTIAVAGEMERFFGGWKPPSS